MRDRTSVLGWKLRLLGDRFLRFLDFVLTELVYQLENAIYKLETPKIIREAETELHKASMMVELEEDDGGLWEQNYEDPNPGDDYYDGREWWLRDQDNPGDR